jgi:hypothetical protein
MVDARKVGLVEQIEVVDATREDLLHEFGIVLPRLLAICHSFLQALFDWDQLPARQ